MFHDFARSKFICAINLEHDLCLSWFLKNGHHLSCFSLIVLIAYLWMMPPNKAEPVNFLTFYKCTENMFLPWTSFFPHYQCISSGIALTIPFGDSPFSQMFLWLDCTPKRDQFVTLHYGTFWMLPSVEVVSSSLLSKYTHCFTDTSFELIIYVHMDVVWRNRF